MGRLGGCLISLLLCGRRQRRPLALLLRRGGGPSRPRCRQTWPGGGRSWRLRRPVERKNIAKRDASKAVMKGGSNAAAEKKRRKRFFYLVGPENSLYDVGVHVREHHLEVRHGLRKLQLRHASSSSSTPCSCATSGSCTLRGGSRRRPGHGRCCCYCRCSCCWAVAPSHQVRIHLGTCAERGNSSSSLCVSSTRNEAASGPNNEDDWRQSASSLFRTSPTESVRWEG